MDASCARAVDLGLPAITFTDHIDLTRWTLAPATRSQVRAHAKYLGADGRFEPPALDVEGYLACLERCRDRYPDLRILSGVEMGEPHWFADQCRGLLAALDADRALGSMHSVRLGSDAWLVTELFEDSSPEMAPDDVMRAYLSETLGMVESFGEFAVLAHIDYPARAWPADAAPFAASRFEEEIRAVLGALAASGRALEVNTRLKLPAEVVRWWRQEGGEAVSFGSDAHEPSDIARGFAEAAAMVESCGFVPGRHPYDFWRRDG